MKTQILHINKGKFTLRRFALPQPKEPNNFFIIPKIWYCNVTCPNFKHKAITIRWLRGYLSYNLNT
jgi:hypothetical protein